MNTVKIFGYGFTAVVLVLAFVACEQPTDSPTGKTLTGITAEYTGTIHIYTFTLLDSLKDH